QENYFEETTEFQTKWTLICDYMPMTFKSRLITLLMPRTLKKQTKQYMQNFKNFVENGIPVTHEKA
ncbi:MAG: SRPBCC family protein, partial [Xanthomarina sp.]